MEEENNRLKLRALNHLCSIDPQLKTNVDLLVIQFLEEELFLVQEERRLRATLGDLGVHVQADKPPQD